MYLSQGCFLDSPFNYSGKFWVTVHHKLSGYNGGADVLGGVNNFFDSWYTLGDVLTFCQGSKTSINLYIHIYLCENVLKEILSNCYKPNSSVFTLTPSIDLQIVSYKNPKTFFDGRRQFLRKSFFIDKIK